MQEQVDVAIVMKAMELAYKNELDSLTLIAGDGDFRDCIEFLTKTAGKKGRDSNQKSGLLGKKDLMVMGKADMMKQTEQMAYSKSLPQMQNEMIVGKERRGLGAFGLNG